MRASFATPARLPATLSPSLNRVRGGNGFVAGKNGGIYQMHQPGTAVVLFPGYLLDRYLLTFKASADGKFPSSFQ
jgi:hypothetical protein